MNRRLFVVIFQKLAFLFLAGFVLQSCIKNDPGNISSDIAIQPEYSLPIGSPTFLMDQYASKVNLGLPIDTLQPLADSLLTFLYNNTCYNSPLVLRDSLLEPFSFITFKDQLEKIKSFMLRTNVINRIPAEIKLQVYFIDAAGQVIDSLYGDSALTVRAASIDDLGNVNGQAEMWKVDNTFSKDEVLTLAYVQYLLIKTRITIVNPKGAIVRFYSSQDIWIQLGLRIAFDINLNDL